MMPSAVFSRACHTSSFSPPSRYRIGGNMTDVRLLTEDDFPPIGTGRRETASSVAVPSQQFSTALL